MLLGLILALAVTARAEQNTQLSYRQLRDGIPAVLNVSQIETRREALAQVRQNLIQTWNQTVNHEACPEYSDTLDQLTAGIDSTLRAWQSTTDPNQLLLNKIRLEVLIPAVSSLHDMFKIKAEAGYGSLDHIPVPTCLRDRKAVEKPFEDYERALKALADDALGVPGFWTLRQDENQLLKIAGRDQIERGRYDLEFMVVTTGTSLALWAIAPYAAAAIATRAALISVPRLLTGAVMVRGAQLLTTPLAMRGGIIGLTWAENLSYNAIDQTLSPSVGEITPNVVHSYVEYLQTYNNLIDAPLMSPELYFIYLSGIKSLLFQNQAHWLNVHHAELNLRNEWQAIVGEARESIASGGLGFVDAQTEIRDRLHNEYKLDVTCKTGYLNGLTDPDCLRGLRQILRALQSLNLPRPSSSVGHVFSVQVGDQFGVTDSADHVVLQIPVDADLRELGARLAANQRSPAVITRSLTLEALEADTERLQSILTPKLEFDANLTNADRWKSVRQLISIFRRSPDLALRRSATAIRIGTANSGLVERHLGIEENIDATANDLSLTNYLGLPPDAILNARIADSRQRLQSFVDRLRESHGWEADCNSRGRLTLRMCATTLKRVQAYLDAHPEVKPRPGFVLIADLEDIDQTVMHVPDSVTGIETLVIRTDFHQEQLIGYGLRVGWLRPAAVK